MSLNIPNEYFQVIIEQLKKETNCEVKYDESTNKFKYLYWSAFFIHIWLTVSDNQVKDLYNKIINKINTQSLLDKYRDVVTYFFNGVKYDDNGIFLSQSFFRKKYFTLAELDDLLDKYNKHLKKIK